MTNDGESVGKEEPLFVIGRNVKTHVASKEISVEVLQETRN